MIGVTEKTCSFNALSILTCFVIQVESKFDDVTDVNRAGEISITFVEYVHSDGRVRLILLILLQIFPV